ncbi:MAG: alpha/beta hydrolase [Gemmatimonadales bacterium]
MIRPLSWCVAAALAAGCFGPGAGDGRISARPGTPSGTLAAGQTTLDLKGGRKAYVYLPAGHTAGQPIPLVLLLHGAGGNGLGAIQSFTAIADSAEVALLTVTSEDQTWDIVLGQIGPDAEAMDEALGQVFARLAVDPAHLVIAGFSDGASSALSYGVTNGDLFTRVVAFSPGFVNAPDHRGIPKIFISHGTSDQILPFANASQLATLLSDAGYGVRFRSFDGGHTVPAAIAREAFAWIADAPTP